MNGRDWALGAIAGLVIAGTWGGSIGRRRAGSRADVPRGDLVATLSDDVSIRIDHDATCHAPTALLYDGGRQVGHAQLSRVDGLDDENLDEYSCVDDIRRLVRRVGTGRPRVDNCLFIG